VLKLADELNNISDAAKRSGVSRDTIYRHKQILREQGPQGLKRQTTHDHHHKNRASKELEKTVLKFSLTNPHLRQAQVSRQIKKVYKIDISPSGVRGIWLREQMQTTALRLHKSNSMATL
jgi:transposase